MHRGAATGSTLDDVSAAIVFAKEIHATLPRRTADEVLKEFVTFETCRNREEGARHLAATLRTKLKEHPELLKKFELYLPKKLSSAGLNGNGQGAMGRGKRGIESRERSFVRRGVNSLSWDDYAASRGLPDLAHANRVFADLMEEVQDESAISSFLHLLDAFNTGRLTEARFLEKLPKAVAGSRVFTESYRRLLNAQQMERNKQGVNASLDQALVSNLTPRVERLKAELRLKLINLERTVSNKGVFVTLKKSMKTYCKGDMGPMMLKAILLDDLRNCPKSNMDAMHELFTVFDGIQSLNETEEHCIKKLLSSLLDEELHQPTLPLEEVEVQNLPRVTPSYCVLPSQCVEFYPSRSRLARSVLNNSLVAISTGTEDTEAEHRSNSSELRIVDVETEIWSTELKIHRMQSLLKHTEGLLTAMGSLSTEDAKKYLQREGLGKNAIHNLVLNKLLGNDRSRVEESINDNPITGVEVFNENLKQKIAEWEEGMQNAREEWQQVFDKNLHRSLDSTYEVFQDNQLQEVNFQNHLREINAKLKCEKKPKRSMPLALVDLQKDLKRSHLTLLFQNRPAVRLCSQAIGDSIQAAHGAVNVEQVQDFWSSFLAPFCCMHALRNPPNNPQHASEETSNGEIKTEEVISSMDALDVSPCPPRRSQSGYSEIILYCDEQFYHLFRLVHFVYSKFVYLSAELAARRDEVPTFMAMISDVNSKRMSKSEFADKLYEVLGSECVGIVGIVDVLSRIVLLMHSLTESYVLPLFEKEIARAHGDDLTDSGRTTLKEFSQKTGRQFPCLDDQGYFLTATTRDPKRIEFRVSYACNLNKMRIRKLDKEIEMLPDSMRDLKHDKTLEASFGRELQSRVLLKRNLTATIRRSGMGQSVLWRYVSMDLMKVKCSSSKELEYEEKLEDWFVSLVRKPIDGTASERKTAFMQSWLRDKHRRSSLKKTCA